MVEGEEAVRVGKEEVGGWEEEEEVGEEDGVGEGGGGVEGLLGGWVGWGDE